MYTLLAIATVLRITAALVLLFIVVPALAWPRPASFSRTEWFWWNLGAGITILTLAGQLFTLLNIAGPLSYLALFAAIIALALAWYLVLALRQFPNARFQEALTADVTMRVFAAAAIAYVFFMFGVRNLLLLLTLSRIDAAVRTLAIALVVNVVVGFVCSRAIAYWAAVAGLVAGSIVLSFFAARAARRTLDDLDYSYYAAY